MTETNNQRDELQKVIFSYFGPTYAINAYRTPEQQDRGLADAILAAGYSKPRTIESVEELDALPVGSVVLNSLNESATKHGSYWYFPAIRHGFKAWAVSLPATVLYEPGAGE